MPPNRAEGVAVVTEVWASYVPSYVSREPYITTEEFLSSPTGCDTSQILPGGTPQQNRDALAGVIQRASNEADVYCYGPTGCLAASVDVQTAPPQGWRVQNRGGLRQIWVPVDNTPVVAVTGVSLGWDPSSVTAVTDLTGVWPGQKVITIPVGGLTTVPDGTVSWTSTSGPAGRVWGNVEYINGYANAALSVDAAAGATSITPTDVLALYPGLQLAIYDATSGHSETVTVAADYVPGTASVTLTAALRYAHLAGTAVSALPPAARQAVVSLTSALIKRRGGESIVLSAIQEEPSRKTMGEPGLSADEKHAYLLLEPFKRVR